MDKTGKHIFPDADFGQIVWTTRKGMRSITMRLKRGGLYVCTSPYQQKSNMLKVVETYRKRLLSLLYVQKFHIHISIGLILFKRNVFTCV